MEERVLSDKRTLGKLENEDMIMVLWLLSLILGRTLFLGVKTVIILSYIMFYALK